MEGAREQTDLIVAVKVLRPKVEQNKDAIRRFTREAKMIARLKHPNIIKIHFFDQDHGRWDCAIDLMEGGTVGSRLPDYVADPSWAAEIMEKVASAIHHAHTRSKGVLHLDLKPANILLDANGEPCVTDFGLCLWLQYLMIRADRGCRESRIARLPRRKSRSS